MHHQQQHGTAADSRQADRADGPPWCRAHSPAQSPPGCLFGAEEKPAGHTCFNAVKLAREHKKSRNWSRSHHVSKKKKMGNRRIRPRSGRKSGAPKAPEPSVGLGFRVRVSVRASHGQNISCVGIFAYLLKKLIIWRGRLFLRSKQLPQRPQKSETGHLI